MIFVILVIFVISVIFVINMIIVIFMILVIYLYLIVLSFSFLDRPPHGDDKDMAWATLFTKEGDTGVLPVVLSTALVSIMLSAAAGPSIGLRIGSVF